MMGKKLVYGVGKNDADYVISARINGMKIMCKFYDAWKRMLERCYSEKFKLRRPTYVGCTVCEDWLTFSNFKSWMEKQDWQGKQLDKDILLAGNKVYSPQNCAFVCLKTNLFVSDHGAARGDWPIGVCVHKKSGKFMAQCANQFTKKHEYLGLFATPEQAHVAWKRRKHEISTQLAATQSDFRVKSALMVMYL